MLLIINLTKLHQVIYNLPLQLYLNFYFGEV